MKFFYSLILIFSFHLACYSQVNQLKIVDFKTADASIKLLPFEKKVAGTLQYSFEILSDTDSIYLDAKNMQANLISSSFKNSELKVTPEHLIFKGKFKKDKVYNFKVYFEAQPKQTLYFLGFDFEKDKHQIWTQGQGKYSSHWLPSIDDMNDKIIFNLSIDAPSYLNVIANGKQQKVIDKASRKIWNYKMLKPMSSYLLALAAGNYDVAKINSSSAIPIYNFYEKSDSTLVEPTYRHTKFIFDFFEEEIGVSYPWQNYKQVPVRDFLHSGMENTSLTIFSNQFMVDSIGFEDFNYVNVNAHELAHQWFGNLVTETEAKHHWLHEAFATYYALLAEREIFGEDYFYYQLYTSAEQLKSLSDEGKGEAILNPKASSITFYQKGAWALHILRERVGKEAFKIAVKNYLEKNAFKNVTTAHFLSEIDSVSEINVDDFKKSWLLQVAFQAEDAVSSLKKSLFMEELLNVISLREEPFIHKIEIFQRKLNQNPNPYLVEEIALQVSTDLENEDAQNLMRQILKSDYTRAQRRILTEVQTLPVNLQDEFEALLAKNHSYLLTENLLFKLWMSFPEKRTKYLTTTKGVIGFKDKNISLLWKFLSMVTPNHEPENAMTYFQELNEFTSLKYNFKIRENSFNYLYQIDRFSDQAYKNLLQACFHQPWIFKKFAKQMLEELLKDEYHKENILNLSSSFSEKEQKLLNSLITNN